MFTEILLQLPFYKNVSLFEQKKYQESFDGFLEIIGKHANICAMHYVLYIINNIKDIKINDTQQPILDKIKELEKSDNIPVDFHPINWLKTSLLKIKYQKEIPSNLDISELKKLAPLCSNAFIWLKEIKQILDQNHIDSNSVNKKKSTKHNKVMQVVLPDLQIIDFYYIENMDNKFDNKALAEKKLLAQSIKWAINNEIERHIAKELDKQNSKFRMLLWQRAGAVMGNQELQWMFSAYDEHDIVSKDDNIRWLIITQKYGHPYSGLALGEIYESGGSSIAKLYGCKYLIDPKMAIKFYEDCLSAKDNEYIKNISNPDLKMFVIQAMGRLGRLYENTVDRKTEAFRYYLRFAKLLDSKDMNFDRACFNVGICLKKGIGTEINLEESILWLSKVPTSSGEYLVSINYIAENYFDLAKEQDALKYLDLIMKNKIDVDRTLQALYYSEKHKSEDNVEQKKIYFQKLVELFISSNGNYYIFKKLRGIYANISDFFDNIDVSLKSKVVETFERNFEKKPQFCYNLAMYYLYSAESAPLIDKALKYLQFGADKEIISCIISLAQYHTNKMAGIYIDKHVDYDKAKELLEQTVKIYPDDINVLNDLGLIYQSDQYQMYKEAYECFIKAIEVKPDAEAYFNLFMMCSNGLFVPQDYEQAFKYLKLAEELAPDDGQINLDLSYLYKFGLGVAQSEIDANKHKLKVQNAKDQYSVLIESNSLLEDIYLTLAISSDGNLDSLSLEKVKRQQKYIEMFDVEGKDPTITLMNCIYLLLIDFHKNKDQVLELLYRDSKHCINSIIQNSFTLLAEVLCVGNLNFNSHLAILGLYSQKITTKEELENYLSKIDGAKLTDDIIDDTQVAIDTGMKEEKGGLDQNLLSKKQINTLQALEDFSKEKIKGLVTIEKFHKKIENLSRYFPELVDVKITPSKSGSNIRHSITIDGERICFGYHPTHKKNSSNKSWIDPNRVDSIQDKTEEIVSKINTKLQKQQFKNK